ncbi:MAG: DUF4870 domain-containing protein [Acidobacteriota bacterium]|nr:DUF4870 domain-containing protein [Acidobacteriota bacterium]
MNYNMQFQPPMSLQTPEQKQMGLFLHLSLLIYTFAFPVGAVAPILIWQLKKDEIPALEAHGKMVTNWMISLAIYFTISFVLAFILIGFLGFLIFGILAIVFPIIGAVKANNGELWEYPLTIKFLK